LKIRIEINLLLNGKCGEHKMLGGSPKIHTLDRVEKILKVENV